MPSKHAVRGIFATMRDSKHAVRGVSAATRGSKHAVRGIYAATRDSKHAAAAVPPAAAAAAAGDCRTNYIILHPLLTIIQYRSKIGPWRLLSPWMASYCHRHAPYCRRHAGMSRSTPRARSSPLVAFKVAQQKKHEGFDCPRKYTARGLQTLSIDRCLPEASPFCSEPPPLERVVPDC